MKPFDFVLASALGLMILGFLLAANPKALYDQIPTETQQDSGILPKL